MITLRVNTYNVKELKELAEGLEAVEYVIAEQHCGDGNCKNCDYRHICYDLAAAREHAKKLYNNALNKDF